MRAGVIKLNAFFRSSPRILRPPFQNYLPIVRHYSFISLLMTLVRKVFRRIVNRVPRLLNRVFDLYSMFIYIYIYNAG